MRHGPHRKHLDRSSFISVCIRCRGNVFTEPFHSNGYLFRLHYSGFQASCHIAPSLRRTAISYSPRGTWLWRLWSPSRMVPHRRTGLNASSCLEQVQPSFPVGSLTATLKHAFELRGGGNKVISRAYFYLFQHTKSRLKLIIKKKDSKVQIWHIRVRFRFQRWTLVSAGLSHPGCIQGRDCWEGTASFKLHAHFHTPQHQSQQWK
jgi:hypothetical protein